MADVRATKTNTLSQQEQLNRAMQNKRIAALREQEYLQSHRQKEQILETQMLAQEQFRAQRLQTDAQEDSQEDEELYAQEMQMDMRAQIEEGKQSNRMAQQEREDTLTNITGMMGGKQEDQVGQLIKQVAPKAFGAIGITTDTASWVSFAINCFQYVPTVSWELTKAVVGTYMLKGQSKIIPPVSLYPLPNIKELVFAYTMFLLMAALMLGILILTTLTFTIVVIGIAYQLTFHTFEFILTNLGALSWLPMLTP
jgi:hypothetical protein